MGKASKRWRYGREIMVETTVTSISTKQTSCGTTKGLIIVPYAPAMDMGNLSPGAHRQWELAQVSKTSVLYAFELLQGGPSGLAKGCNDYRRDGNTQHRPLFTSTFALAGQWRGTGHMLPAVGAMSFTKFFIATVILLHMLLSLESKYHLSRASAARC